MTNYPKVPSRPPATVIRDPADVVSHQPELWRIHPVKGPHPMPWNGFRTFGPLHTARFDPHPGPQGDHPGYGVAYTALDVVTCAAEVFQSSRRIALTDEYDLTGWTAACDLRLLDLTGTWAMRNGAANSLASAQRSVCREWSAKIRTTWPDLDGLLSLSTMTGRNMVTLFESAARSFPAAPAFRRPLDHPIVQAIMVQAADECGYTVA